MRPVVTPRHLVIFAIAVASAVIADWYCWPREDDKWKQASAPSPPGTGTASEGAAAKSKLPDFSALPPRERIMAETKHRMEGDQSR